MKMVNMVWCAVPCKAKDGQTFCPRLRQHLHADRAPLEDGAPLQMQRTYQIVRRLCRTRVGAGEYLRVCNQELLLVIHCQSRILDEIPQILIIEFSDL